MSNNPFTVDVLDDTTIVHVESPAGRKSVFMCSSTEAMRFLRDALVAGFAAADASAQPLIPTGPVTLTESPTAYDEGRFAGETAMQRRAVLVCKQGAHDTPFGMQETALNIVAAEIAALVIRPVLGASPDPDTYRAGGAVDVEGAP